MWTLRLFERELKVLQWSHVFSNVEMHELEPRGFDVVHASMEPRFFKRGNGAEIAHRGDFLPRFNGATFFQTWKF